MGFDNTNRGFLMRNEKKHPGSKQPDHTGTLNVDGREFKLSAWVRESKTGKRFFSLAITPAEQKQPHDQQQHDHHHHHDQPGASDDLDAALPADRATPAAPLDADLAIHYRVAFDILTAARKLWPGERPGSAGARFAALLAKFGVEQVEHLTPSQGEQMLAYLTEQANREPGVEG
jgi:hypothetical protein